MQASDNILFVKKQSVLSNVMKLRFAVLVQFSIKP